MAVPRARPGASPNTTQCKPGANPSAGPKWRPQVQAPSAGPKCRSFVPRQIPPMRRFFPAEAPMAQHEQAPMATTGGGLAEGPKPSANGKSPPNSRCAISFRTVADGQGRRTFNSRDFSFFPAPSCGPASRPDRAAVAAAPLPPAPPTPGKAWLGVSHALRLWLCRAHLVHPQDLHHRG